jgi:hypothetical protein
LAQKQFEALREFWDPAYDNPYSWTNNKENRGFLWEPFHPLLPVMKRIVREHYPGTKLLLGEYSTGSSGRFHGCLLRAVALGIFAREGLDMAAQWGEENLKPGNFIHWTYKLYNNYDGRGGAFRGHFMDSGADTKDLYSFAALDGSKWSVMLVNRNPGMDLVTDVRFPGGIRDPKAHLLCESLGLRLVGGVPRSVGSDMVRVRVPAFSAVLVTAVSGS